MYVTVNLWLLIVITRRELVRVQDETLKEVEYHTAAEARPAIASSVVVPARGALSCPQGEEGLHTVTFRATVNEIVLGGGVILPPLNTTIPKRDAWRALAYLRYSGRYSHEGRVQTLQNGWMGSSSITSSPAA